MIANNEQSDNSNPEVLAYIDYLKTSAIANQLRDYSSPQYDTFQLLLCMLLLESNTWSVFHDAEYVRQVYYK